MRLSSLLKKDYSQKFKKIIKDLLIVLGAGLALATGALVSVGLGAVVAVFGLVIGLVVVEEVFGTAGDLVGLSKTITINTIFIKYFKKMSYPVLAGAALAADAALAEGAAFGEDTEDLDIGFTSPTLGDAEIDFLGSALP